MEPTSEQRWEIEYWCGWKDELCVGGLDWVIRDENGDLIKAGCTYLRDMRDVDYLEMLAICEGLRTVLLRNRHALYLESDSLMTIRFLQQQQEDLNWNILDQRRYNKESRGNWSGLHDSH